MSNSDQANDRNGGFYIIDNRLIDEYGSIIGVFGIAVYSLIAKYSNEKGENAFPSYQTIADKLGISRPKAVTTINQLVELGLIKKEKRRDDAGDSTSNLYTIVPMGGGKCGLPPSQPELPQVVNDINQGGKPHLPYQYPINNTKLDQPSKNLADKNQSAVPVGKKEKKESTAYVHPETGVTTQAIYDAWKVALDHAEPDAVISHGKEKKAAKQLAQAGKRPSDITTCFWKMKRENKFYKINHLSLTAIATNIAAVMSQGKFSQPVNTNGVKSVFAKDFQESEA